MSLPESVVGLEDGDESASSPFLVTTALEEFWDETRPIAFLGLWCRKYSSRLQWGKLNGDLLLHPWEERRARSQAHLYVQEVCARLLPELAQALNELHGARHSDRYWTIAIGSWVYSWVSTLYERWVCIQAALERYPHLVTIGLDEGSFVTPRNSWEYANLIKTDLFNLQIYTQILSWLGVPLPRKPAVAPTEVPPMGSNGWRARVRSLVSVPLALTRRALPRYDRVFLESSYLPGRVRIEIAVRTLGRVWPLMRTGSALTDVPIDSGARDRFSAISLGRDAFECFLAHSITGGIPRSYVEQHSAIEKEVLRVYPTNPKAILSANSWHFDDVFKLWAAESAERGTVLAGSQHGGTYGSLALNPGEGHELATADIFFSWGWERSGCHAEVVPMPAAKLVGRPVLGASNRKDGVLWGATAEPRYPGLFPLPNLPSCFSDYLRWQLRFASALSPGVLNQLRFRPHREDLGWEIVPRMRAGGFDLPIDTWAVPFEQSLQKCRLYVCDHFSTTFAEALAANKPTILFWDQESNLFRSDAEPYFDKLRVAGILFHDPEAAADAVNDVYPDVESWWNVRSRQEAVRHFCDRFARTANDGVERWTAELGKIGMTSTKTC